jgi:hypothetical protein
MENTFLDRDDERYNKSGRYFVKEGSNDKKEGKILGEFHSYIKAVDFAKGLGTVVEDKISNRKILPES